MGMAFNLYFTTYMCLTGQMQPCWVRLLSQMLQALPYLNTHTVPWDFQHRVRLTDGGTIENGEPVGAQTL